MRLRICACPDFENRIKDKELVCFGAGTWAADTAHIFPDFGFYNQISYFVDNNAALHNTTKIINEKEIPIKPPDYLYRNASKEMVVLLTLNAKNALKVLNQLNGVHELDNIDVYIGHMIIAYSNMLKVYRLPAAPADFKMNMEQVIPKKLHYCWVGGKAIPDNYRKWMESWRKYCSDYEIIEWNESNYDFTKQAYMKTAYENKVWGFVPDYARLDIIYEHGGVYLDTDVEIVRPLDDLLYNSAFMGFEATGYVNLGLGFGAAAGHPLIRDLRDGYDKLIFDNQIRMPSPVLNTDYLRKRGLKANGEFQIVENCAFYPAEYFSPYAIGVLNKLKNTYSIHHFDGSWVDEELKKETSRMHELCAAAIAYESTHSALE